MTDTRDARGRYLPGTSGNPRGRPPGRAPRALNSLADEAVAAVLTHDLDVVHDQAADPRLRKEALNRLTRLGACRITPASDPDPEETADQIVEIIERHVPDRHVRHAIARDLGRLSDPRAEEDDDAEEP